MRAALTVTGVLGIGTALVFAAAALVSLAFPNGGTVAAGWNGGAVWGKGGVTMPMPVPAPVVDDTSGGSVIAPDPAPADQ
jgi:hypothetical protein